ncbi:hypothetical protein [Nocardia abscessus]|uniref:hypothetical protein n=1 Tax=Nocardia abscessus TaxID=120957 RepID=UPI002454C68A|nr:hypothetical protein [Nocardia abscessus]
MIFPVAEPGHRVGRARGEQRTGAPLGLAGAIVATGLAIGAVLTAGHGPARADEHTAVPDPVASAGCAAPAAAPGRSTLRFAACPRRAPSRAAAIEDGDRPDVPIGHPGRAPWPMSLSKGRNNTRERREPAG